MSAKNRPILLIGCARHVISSRPKINLVMAHIVASNVKLHMKMLESQKSRAIQCQIDNDWIKIMSWRLNDILKGTKDSILHL